VENTRRAAFEAWLANVLAAWLSVQAFLRHAPESLGLSSWLFLELSLLSQVALFALPLWGASWLLSRWLRAGAWASFAALLWSAYHLYWFVDARVYNLFRYHLNGWVWTVVTTDGADDSVQLDGWFWLRAAALCGALYLAQLLFLRWRARRGLGREGARARLRPARALALLAAAVGTEKALYARADLAREREIVAVARLVPGYQRVTVKRLARSWFGYELEARERVSVSSRGLMLRYPLEHPSLASAGARPNILVIAVESLRADALTSEGMPNLWAFAQRSRVFSDHASGGSTSRYGTFALLYGLHGSYFAPVYAENASPVLVDRLLELGYEFRIWGTASMSFPELRSTAWVKVESAVEDKLPRTRGESRDAELVRRFTAWLAQRRSQASAGPFFCFAFVDAPHANYNLSTGVTPFEPFAQELDFFELTGGAAREQAPLVYNRYRNAVYDADRSLGAMLEALASSGELERTLVLITGDHGEEFYEHGFWGHTSNFTRTQVLVPLVLRGPGVEPGRETRPTCHVDVVPTLLELLGADPAQRERYSTGLNLLAPPERRARVLAGWDTLGLWTEQAILVLPLDAYGGAPEAYDYDWKPLAEPARAWREGAEGLRELTESCRRFLR
jgi:hypothetical protein